MMALPLPAGLSLLARFAQASGWHATQAGLMQSLPHLTEKVSAQDCIAALRNIGLPLSFVTGRTVDLNPDDLPALRIADDGKVSIIRSRSAAHVLVETASGAETWEAVCREQATFVRIAPAADPVSPQGLPEIGAMVRQFRPIWISLLFASLFTNALALAGPVLIMIIYDRAIPTGATELIFALACAMGIVLLTDFVLRSVRGHAIAHMAAAMEGRLGLGLFRKLSALPLSEHAKSDVDQQIARLKQFEGMREAFSGPVFATLLDIPFIVMFLGVLFAISPAIGATMLMACAAFALAAFATVGPLARRNEAAGQARTAQQKLIFEAIQQQRTLQRLGADAIWAERHRHLARQSAAATGTARRFQMSCQALGQSIMAVSGICAVFLGTELAMTGAIGFGALIAIMSLVWKCLAPVHALYSNWPQIQGFRKSGRQINRVLGLPEEFTRGAALSELKDFKGGITTSNLTFRHAGVVDAALANLNLDIQPGECVVVAGPNGSGKTTLLDLLAGLQVAQGGTLKFDRVDARQIAVDDLRHMVSYARQVPDFFHGTLWQNFQLARPDISREDAMAAIAQVGLEDEIRHFPEGLDTRLSEAFRKTLPISTLRGLSLARCLARPAAIYLFDDPATGLDAQRNAALTEVLNGLRRKRTVLLTSNTPDHIRIADRIVVLEEGRILLNDTGDAARRKYDALQERKRPTS